MLVKFCSRVACERPRLLITSSFLDSQLLLLRQLPFFHQHQLPKDIFGYIIKNKSENKEIYFLWIIKCICAHPFLLHKQLPFFIQEQQCELFKTKIAWHLWFPKVGPAVYMRGYLRSICTILPSRGTSFPNWEFITQLSKIEHIFIIMLRIKIFENLQDFSSLQFHLQYGAISVFRLSKVLNLKN